MSWIAGSKRDAVNAVAALSPRSGPGTLYADVGAARLYPFPLTDGRYAVPDQVLTDTTYGAAAVYLDDWTAESSPAFVPFPNNWSAQGWRLSVANGTRLLITTGHIGSLTMPADNVYRFEVRPGERGATADITNSVNVRRRSTLASYGTLAVPKSNSDPSRLLNFQSGDTVWYSTTLVMGDYSTNHAIDQDTFVFSSGQSNGRNGAFEVTVGDSWGDGMKLNITTRSSAQLYSGSTNGFPIRRYNVAAPAKGVKTNIVAQATFGESGHLNAWINGTQVVNVDAPLGYYATDTYMAGIEAGLYTWDGPGTDVMYLANLEYGTDSLSARITSPTSVPDLDW